MKNKLVGETALIPNKQLSNGKPSLGTIKFLEHNKRASINNKQ
jgi:hypothetical protein